MTTQGKHTEGPWEVMDGDHQEGSFIVVGPGQCYIALVADEGCPDDNFDNARLIAASPDLLQAIKELIEQVDGLEGYELTRDLPTHEAEAVFDDALARARAAIRKAEGEQ